MMILRAALTVVLALGLLAAPLAAGAQPAGKVWRVGFLSMGSREDASPPMISLKTRLRELGYVEGQNLVFVYRGAEGKAERLPHLAAELVRENVAVLMAGGGTLTARAAKDATSTIPVVMTAVGDPVASGLVASLARPGGTSPGWARLPPTSLVSGFNWSAS
jgi:ABC-type uncharacterized transport system substrate-binding protein